MQVIKEVLSTVALAAVSLMSLNIEFADLGGDEKKKHVSAIVVRQNSELTHMRPKKE